MAEPKRLKHAPQAVIEVIAKHGHGDDVEQRHGPNLEAKNDIVVNVVVRRTERQGAQCRR